MRPVYSTERVRPPLLETYEVVIAGLILAGGWFAWYLLRERYRLTQRQVAELAVYLAIVFVSAYAAIYHLATRRLQREKQ
jgi:cytochrome bd-type quinol oxidase subunit 1